MHDQDPQDQPRRHEFRRWARTPARSTRSIASWRLAEDLALAQEEPVNLHALDGTELEMEARREALRDQRQARALRRADAQLDLRHRAVSISILILAALTAITVIATGLVRGSEGLVHSGLLAFGAICGALYWQQRLLAELRLRRSGGVSSTERITDAQG